MTGGGDIASCVIYTSQRDVITDLPEEDEF